ncbi:hypothetical protein BGZ70_001723, partial [Mortierella alpina]
SMLLHTEHRPWGMLELCHQASCLSRRPLPRRHPAKGGTVTLLTHLPVADAVVTTTTCRLSPTLSSAS